MANRSQHDPSRPILSAEVVSWCRALAHREPDSRSRNPDGLAHIFLRPLFRWLLRPRRLWKWLLELRAPGLYHLHLARTLYVDSAVRDALAAGATQLVILGAGNDSRPYRLGDVLTGVRVFEVDFPGTQERKKHRLRRHFGVLPPGVVFVPIDFESQSLAAVLPAAGYDPAARTVFNWEGVSCFLHPDAVDQVLRFVATHSGAGSRLIFDLLDREAVDGDHPGFGASRLHEACARMGEPLRFGWPRAEAPSAWLAEHGLRLLDASTPAAMEARFFAGQPERRMIDCFRMVTVEVDGGRTA